ncbi:uncharacterized protein [Miscanthus floridulus]|uniref:uncharacterized protein n=1 Tax=Miscanthus floridulus TaxID=154761 RepID=UPI003459D1A5
MVNPILPPAPVVEEDPNVLIAKDDGMEVEAEDNPEEEVEPFEDDHGDGVQVYPLTQIDLPVTFGNRANFRSEVLTFEVVDFPGSYHTILGQPCYAKFMAIPNYTYLKLKMSGPNDVITVGSTFSHAFTCDHKHYELATTVINSFEFLRLGELLTPAVLDYNKPTSSAAFCPLEETKAVGIDPTDPTKMVRIKTQLPTK